MPYLFLVMAYRLICFVLSIYETRHIRGPRGSLEGMEKTPNFVNNMADCIEIAMFGLVNHQNYPI